MGRTYGSAAALASVVVSFLLAAHVHAACVEFPGYVALENTDHYYGDIGQAATPSDAEVLCTADPTCKGFNSLGWYKNIISPISKLMGVCLYIKVAECPQVPGYFLIPNADHFGLGGDDLGKAESFLDAISSCNSDSRCKGFNSAGYYKQVVAPAQTMAWSCLYTKECPPMKDYVAFPNTDRVYGDIGRAFSFPDALSKCSYDSTCKGVNNLGWHKTTTSPVTKDMGVCLYTKRTECPQVNGYNLKPGVDHAGDDIGKAESLPDAISKCNADGTCKGFNNAGSYKRFVAPTTATAGSCLYTKIAPAPSPRPPPSQRASPPPSLRPSPPPSPPRSPPPTLLPSPSPLSQWTPLWADEFNDNALDTTSWNYFIGPAYNNELQYYSSRKENVRLENGNLVIEARLEAMGGKGYTSGRIDTRLKRAYYPGMSYGGRTYSKIRIESRIRLPKGQGFWPAFWLLPSSTTCDACGPYGSWPYSGEIDILEAINDISFAAFTLHYMAGSRHQQSQALLYSDQLALQWHTYTLEWAADQMWWYVDGVLRGTLKSASLVPDGWKTTSTTSTQVKANSPFDAPFYIIFNLAVGGDWPGSPNGRTGFPESLLVDYVRVDGS